MGKNISIIIPTYNRSDTLKLVIDSYYKQKYIEEVIIIDDGSSCSYTEILSYLDQNYKSIRTVYIRNETNQGAGSCRNIGINNATCEYILWGEDDAFLSDDLILSISVDTFFTRISMPKLQHS